MKLSRLIALFASIIYPIFFIIVAYVMDLFDTDFSVLTLRNLWDVFWISGVVWLAILCIVGVGMYFARQMTDVNGTVGFVGIAIFPIVLFWIVTYFKGLWDVAFSTWTIGLIWDILWIIVLAMVVVIIIAAIVGFLKIPAMGKRK